MSRQSTITIIEPVEVTHSYDFQKLHQITVHIEEEVMTKTKTTTHKEEPKPAPKAKSIHDVLEEIKAELLTLESSSSHGEFRQAARDAVAIIEKYIGQ